MQRWSGLKVWERTKQRERPMSCFTLSFSACLFLPLGLSQRLPCSILDILRVPCGHPRSVMGIPGASCGFHNGPGAVVRASLFLVLRQTWSTLPFLLSPWPIAPWRPISQLRIRYRWAAGDFKQLHLGQALCTIPNRHKAKDFPLRLPAATSADLSRPAMLLLPIVASAPVLSTLSEAR